MGWTWCSGIGQWVAKIGPVPGGYTYPVDGSNTPDLSALVAGPDGEIDLFSAGASFDLCTYSPAIDHVAYEGNSPPGWGEGTTIGGTTPAGTHLYVVAGGPVYDETDPMPWWDPADALTGPTTPAYEARVVAQDGTLFGTLGAGRVTRVSWELNGPGSAEISLATTDPDAPYLQPGREIQIYYQGDLVWWGPIVRPQASLNESSWQCAGLLWYFQHRFMGRADRVNQLTNGDFESSETGWTFTGVTHSVNTDPDFIQSGTKSEKLTGATADHATYMSQTYTHTAGGYPGGDYLTGSVYVWIPAADYVGGALEDFGLLLRHRRAGTIITTEGGPDSALPALIGDDTPKDKWNQLETGVPLVREGDTIEFMLFPPHGIAYFDLATLTFMESLSFGYPDTPADVTDIIKGIVAYAQDLAPYNFGHGKSDLNIDWAGDATGVLRQLAYQFEEHRNILDAITEYIRQGACDINIEITPTTRTLTVYPKSTDSRTPKLGKGTLYGTTLELDVNLADYTWSQDLEQAASSVILIGPGDGPDRPEGNATDTSLLGGAFTLEIVEQAPDNTTIGQLDIRAAERLAVAARPEILEVTTLPGAGIIGDLLVGDTVPVVIVDGWVNISATYRVARIDADLLKDQATIALNAIPPEV